MALSLRNHQIQTIVGTAKSQVDELHAKAEEKRKILEDDQAREQFKEKVFGLIDMQPKLCFRLN